MTNTGASAIIEVLTALARSDRVPSKVRAASEQLARRMAQPINLAVIGAEEDKENLSQAIDEALFAPESLGLFPDVAACLASFDQHSWDFVVWHPEGSATTNMAAWIDQDGIAVERIALVAPVPVPEWNSFTASDISDVATWLTKNAILGREADEATAAILIQKYRDHLDGLPKRTDNWSADLVGSIAHWAADLDTNDTNAILTSGQDLIATLLSKAKGMPCEIRLDLEAAQDQFVLLELEGDDRAVDIGLKLILQLRDEFERPGQHNQSSDSLNLKAQRAV